MKFNLSWFAACVIAGFVVGMLLLSGCKPPQGESHPKVETNPRDYPSVIVYKNYALEEIDTEAVSLLGDVDLVTQVKGFPRDGRTLVVTNDKGQYEYLIPIRALGNALGLDVQWNKRTQDVTIEGFGAAGYIMVRHKGLARAYFHIDRAEQEFDVKITPTTAQVGHRQYVHRIDMEKVDAG